MSQGVLKDCMHATLTYYPVFKLSSMAHAARRAGGRTREVREKEQRETRTKGRGHENDNDNEKTENRKPNNRTPNTEHPNRTPNTEHRPLKAKN